MSLLMLASFLIRMFSIFVGMETTFDIFQGQVIDLDYTPYLKLIIDKYSRFSGMYDKSVQGILIKSYQIHGKEYELRIDGECLIKNAAGEEVDVPEYLLEYYRRKEEDGLCFEKLPWLKLLEIKQNSEAIDHGVYYCIGDAEYYLKVLSSRTLINSGI